MPPIRQDTRGVSIETWERAIAHYERHKGKHGLDAELIRRFGVNKNTIRARIRSKNTGVTSWGPSTIFTISEEVRMKEAIFYLADSHFALSKSALMKFVGDFAESIGKNRPGDAWYQAFMARHPDVSLKCGTKQSAARYQALTRKVVDTFYDLVEKHVVGVSPDRVFILDETGLEVSSSLQVSRSFCGFIAPHKEFSILFKDYSSCAGSG